MVGIRTFRLTRVEDVSDSNFAPVVAAWRERRSSEGSHVGLHELYAMVAQPRGLTLTELPLEDRESLTELAQAVFWPGYQRVTETRPSEPVDVVPYDDEWPLRFDTYATTLRSHLGSQPYRIDHIGSTSVPGLAAKPIIDILLCVTNLEDEASYVPAAERSGFELVTRDDAHRFFQVPWPAPRDAQLHVCRLGDPFDTAHLLFRDYLRHHDDVRDAYAELKRTAAVAWRDDRVGYTYAKNSFILNVIEQAANETEATA